MNKSSLTNILALAIFLVGMVLDHQLIKSAGLFALSGAITNWLAVHMLFEKVPGLYGSGVVPNHFQEFRDGIRKLLMEQFFTEENIQRFLTDDRGDNGGLDLTRVIENVDLDPSFDALVQTVEESSFGGMLSMLGGSEALQPLKPAFVDKMRASLVTLSSSESFQESLTESLRSAGSGEGVGNRIEAIIEQRLEELTPQLVKQIIQEMIRSHLGWLVVWGGVFGGVIGLVAGLVGI